VLSAEEGDSQRDKQDCEQRAFHRLAQRLKKCFSYNWKAICGYHYLMRLGHALNVLARYSCALAKHVRIWGVRGLINLVRATIAAPWLRAEAIQRIATALCQLRLE